MAYISGTSAQDGILIGANASAESNVLLNIRGSALQNVVHISANTSSQSDCPLVSTGTPNNVCDVTLMGVTGPGSSTNTIKDELTNSSITDAKIGMYVVGEQMLQAGGSTAYSRFTTTTSTLAPTWLVGSAAPTQTTCAIGSLYSRTGTSGTTSVWQCVGGTTFWKPVK